MTSDERREVAQRLRKFAKTVTHNHEYLWAHLEIAVNGWYMGVPVDESYMYDNKVLSRLADLIDPTCEVVGTTSEDVLYGPTIFHHELSCGHTCDTCCEEPPAYCHECGCRVVESDNQKERTVKF